LGEGLKGHPGGHADPHIADVGLVNVDLEVGPGRIGHIKGSLAGAAAARLHCLDHAVAAHHLLG